MTARGLLGRVQLEEFIAEARESDPDMPKRWAKRVLKRLDVSRIKVISMDGTPVRVVAEARDLFLQDVARYLDAA